MRGNENGPGAALFLLRRAVTSTDVMLEPDLADGSPFRVAASRSDTSQRGLVEELIQACPSPAVDRLYASALTIPGQDGPLGVFVGFVDRRSAEASACAWTDLREAGERLPSAWSAVLEGVRERFIARAPDEALRIR